MFQCDKAYKQKCVDCDQGREKNIVQDELVKKRLCIDA